MQLRVLQHLPGAASIRDRAGRYTYVNGAWENALGLKAEDVLGKPYYAVLDAPDGFRARIRMVLVK